MRFSNSRWPRADLVGFLVIVAMFAWSFSRFMFLQPGFRWDRWWLWRVVQGEYPVWWTVVMVAVLIGLVFWLWQRLSDRAAKRG